VESHARRRPVRWLLMGCWFMAGKRGKPCVTAGSWWSLWSLMVMMQIDVSTIDG